MCIHIHICEGVSEKVGIDLQASILMRTNPAMASLNDQVSGSMSTLHWLDTGWIVSAKFRKGKQCTKWVGKWEHGNSTAKN